MAKTIFDISKKIGLEVKVVFAKAAELGIVGAKVSNSSLDEITAEWLIEELVKSNPIVGERRNIFGTPNASKLPNPNSANPPYMKPNLIGCRIQEVAATTSWNSTLTHRVYSCPDTPDYQSSLGATALILRNNATGIRIPLEVCSVTRVPADMLGGLNGLSEPFRQRAEQYLADVGNDPQIIHPGCNHRLYFLGTEPWPANMQVLTAACPATEWSAILSICADSNRFFRWPRVGELFWPGCVRAANNGEYQYPAELASLLHRLNLKPDTRTNGPAIVSFLAAGGERPSWGSEGWHIHHVFDGTEGAPHAVHDGNLFTHSAGLVAAHPVAHHLAHQSALLKWLLRRESFLRFGFDPNGDFAVP